MKNKELQEKLIDNLREELQDIGLDGKLADEIAREEIKNMTPMEIITNLKDLNSENR